MQKEAKTETALQLVSYEQARKLKEIGFNWATQHYYTKHGNWSHDMGKWIDYNKEKNYYSCPTVALALKWFREVHEIDCGLEFKLDDDTDTWFYVVWYADRNTKILNSSLGMEFGDYEEAESALLDALIKYVEEDKCKKK
jgi:hypothetical protein